VKFRKCKVYVPPLNLYIKLLNICCLWVS